MRLLFVIGLLFICFMSGVLYGKSHHTTAEVIPDVTEEKMEVITDSIGQTTETENERLIGTEDVVTPAYKVASALESIVNFFYEVIVVILYQISKLFF